jgi:hypothetical protein
VSIRRAGLALVPLLLVALLLVSCGDDDGTDETAAPVTQQNLAGGLSGEKEQAAKAIEAYLAAFASGDPDQICPLTSRTEAALERCKDSLPEFHPPNKQPPYELQVITIHGPRADAKIVQKSGQGKPVFFQLQNVGGEWKIVVATLQG